MAFAPGFPRCPSRVPPALLFVCPFAHDCCFARRQDSSKDCCGCKTRRTPRTRCRGRIRTARPCSPPPRSPSSRQCPTGHGCTGAAEQQFIDLPRAPSGCQHPRATYIQQTLNMAYSDPPFPARACVPFVQMEAGQSQAGQQDAVSGEHVHQDRREIFPFYHDDCQDNRRPPAAGREPNVSTDSPLGGMANDDPDGPSLPLWGRLPQCQ